MLSQKRWLGVVGKKLTHIKVWRAQLKKEKEKGGKVPPGIKKIKKIEWSKGPSRNYWTKECFNWKSQSHQVRLGTKDICGTRNLTSSELLKI